MIKSTTELLLELSLKTSVEYRQKILIEWANEIVRECAANFEADPNPDEPGQYSLNRASVLDVEKQIL